MVDSVNSVDPAASTSSICWTGASTIELRPFEAAPPPRPAPLPVPVALVTVPGPAAELVGSYPTPAVDPAPVVDPGMASAAYPEP
ncbi:hypothetical protein SUGI_1455240 [Cryptomeria japonica]|uniref:Uncharacterized protein n=1 Tax=Cryptomeria japonica TaxID=3369 RepID=A0AAD3NUU8_CRYJA|nr:hypothetical protein SUGI_1455240 [Cryptomeria japonica]